MDLCPLLLYPYSFASIYKPIENLHIRVIYRSRSDIETSGQVILQSTSRVARNVTRPRVKPNYLAAVLASAWGPMDNSHQGSIKIEGDLVSAVLNGIQLFRFFFLSSSSSFFAFFSSST